MFESEPPEPWIGAKTPADPAVDMLVGFSELVKELVDSDEDVVKVTGLIVTEFEATEGLVGEVATFDEGAATGSLFSAGSDKRATDGTSRACEDDEGSGEVIADTELPVPGSCESNIDEEGNDGDEDAATFGACSLPIAVVGAAGGTGAAADC